MSPLRDSSAFSFMLIYYLIGKSISSLLYREMIHMIMMDDEEETQHDVIVAIRTLIEMSDYFIYDDPDMKKKAIKTLKHLKKRIKKKGLSGALDEYPD